MADRIDTGVLTWLRVDRLQVDHSYQRPLNKHRVKLIARDFDPYAFDVVSVSQRDDGTYWIIDGQQRCAAAVIAIGGDQQVPAILYRDLTVEQEAKLFHQLNEGRTRPRPLELHAAALRAVNPRAVEVEATVQLCGLKIGSGNEPGHVACVSTLYAIYDNAGRAVLRRTLRLVTQAWGRDREGLNAAILSGVAVLVARHTIDDKRLITKLAKIDPIAIQRAAKVKHCDMAAISRPRMGTVVAAIIAQAYNTRLPADKKIHFDMDKTGRPYWKKDA